MKVMILSSYAPTLFFFREDMMLAMLQKGHEVIAVAPEPESEWKEKFEQRNIKYYSIENIDRTSTNPFKDIQGLISIYRLIRKNRPDRIFTYQAKTVIYGCIAARLARIKDVFPMMGGLGSVFRSDDSKSFVRDILKTEFKLAFGLSKKVFFQNKDDVDEIIKARLTTIDKIVMINGSGVNLDKFIERPLPSSLNFLFVGRIIRDKGVTEYLKAARIIKGRFPDVNFQLVGYFDTNPTAISKAEIQKYVDQGIVEYLGSTNDVREFLANSSIFVLPSYHEGTPKSVLEAMATGRPIITTDAPGCRETVLDGVNGFLVPIRNVEQLADKMSWMIEHPAEVMQMGKESLKLCREKFDVNKVNQVIMETMGL